MPVQLTSVGDDPMQESRNQAVSIRYTSCSISTHCGYAKISFASLQVTFVSRQLQQDMKIDRESVVLQWCTHLLPTLFFCSLFLVSLSVIFSLFHIIFSLLLSFLQTTVPSLLLPDPQPIISLTIVPQPVPGIHTSILRLSLADSSHLPPPAQMVFPQK